MMLNIPTGRRGEFLNTRMSYLKFRFTNTGAQTDSSCSFDYTASSIIERLELYHGSNLLEQIHGYNVLHSLLTDAMGSLEAQTNTGTILEGISSKRDGQNGAPGESIICCVPILSGIIGVGQEKYLPTGDAMTGDLRLELTLSNTNDGVVGEVSKALSWQVSEVELMLEFTQLNAEAARMIQMQNSSGYMISFDTYAQYTNTVEAGATNANILIPARYSSLKTLYTVMRKQSNIGKINVATISERLCNFVAGGQWYYSIGGKNVPTTPVKSTTETFAEFQKALHAFGAMNASSLMDKANWETTTFAIGMDLETLPHKSKLTESGVNTLATNTYLICQFPNPAGPTHVATFAHYDGVLLIQNGICSVMF